MIPERAQELIRRGNALFTKRQNLDSYYQELAENFYPERAQFTTGSDPGRDWWDGSMTSQPVLRRRELGDLQSVMLRQDEWFGLSLLDDELNEDITVRRWLEWMTKTQRSAMYYTPARFTENMKLTDHDWVTFGMGVLEIDVRRDMASLIYRNHHISQFAWADNDYGETDTVFRKWNPTIRTLQKVFPDTAHESVKDATGKDLDKEIPCFRAIVPRADYDGDYSRRKTPLAPWVSVWLDIENETVMGDVPQMWMRYVMPRWQRIHGSQYGWSPATGPGLADARTLQQLMLILLEASEKAADPPLMAVEEALRSDLNVYSGGVTFFDGEHLEKKGDPLRVLDVTGRGLPFGFEMLDRHDLILKEGFFLNKLQLPQFDGEQPTAYHVRHMIEEHIRAATPLLAPAEDEYSARVCEGTFEVLKLVKAFGPEENIPEIIRETPLKYRFNSPLRELADEMKAETLREVVAITLEVMQVAPEQAERVNWDEAYVDALQGKRAPAGWLKTDQEFQQRLAQMREQQAAQAGMEALQQGAAAAKDGAGAVKQIADAGA